MPDHIRKMLIGMGMNKDATEEEARKFAADNNVSIVDTRDIGSGANTREGAVLSPDEIRANMLEIMQLGDTHNCRKAAEAAIGEGLSVEAFKCRILETQYKAAPAQTAEIGLSKKEVQNFSFCRSILAQITGNWELAPFEREVSNATAKQMRQNPKGFFIPIDVMGRSLGVDPEQVRQVRDAVVGTATAGGNLVATELLAGDFITMLRANLVLNTLGVTFIPGLVGNIAIPKQTGGASYYFVGEQEAPTKSNPTFSQIGMTPKTVGGRSVISRQLLMQSSIGVEQFVRSEIARAVAEGIEYGAFLGTGSDSEPLGLLNMPSINNVAIGANGGFMTGDHVVAMETEVSDDNVIGAMSYLTNARVRGKLKRTQEFDGTNGAPIWKTEKGSQGIGDLNGYPAYIAGTTAIPKDGTKGTGTNLSTAVFGKWSDMVVGLWGVLDMLVDPYSQGDQGDIKIRALQSFDVKVRHEESFCKCADIKTTAVSTS